MTFRFKSILLSTLGAAWLALPAVALAQQPPARQRTLEPPSASPIAPQPLQNSIDTIRPNYELGTNDQILVHAPDAEELNDKPFRIDDDGTVTLPLVGVVKAAGLTVQQFEDDLKNRLKTYIKNPLINVTVVQFRSSPVFFVGEFQKPGIYALQGRHTLVEMLMNMGGLQPNASRRIKITRKNESGPIPLPGAIEDPQTKTSSVEINLAALSENVNPAEDIVLQPYDVISVERAEMVYVQGAVAKVGGFDVGEKDSISVLQVLSLAGGLTTDAIPEKATILRPVLNTTRRAEIPLNLNRVLAAEGTDYPILPNDVIFVPRKKPTSTLASRTGIVMLSIIPSVIFSLLLRR